MTSTTTWTSAFLKSFGDHSSADEDTRKALDLAEWTFTDIELQRHCAAHAALCRAGAPPESYPHNPTQCWSLDFSRGSVRYTDFTGDWDPGYYKGECAPDEYVAGISQSPWNGSSHTGLETKEAECGEGRYIGGVSRYTGGRDPGRPHAILCCSP